MLFYSMTSGVKKICLENYPLNGQDYTKFAIQSSIKAYTCLKNQIDYNQLVFLQVIGSRNYTLTSNFSQIILQTQSIKKSQPSIIFLQVIMTAICLVRPIVIIPDLFPVSINIPEQPHKNELTKEYFFFFFLSRIFLVFMQLHLIC